MNEQNKLASGLLFAIGAYGAWGILPIYWKALQAVDALQIIGHRMVWSMFFLLALLALRGKYRWLFEIIRKPRVVGAIFLAGVLLTLNWLVYIYGVNIGRVVETSLGYFINPLLSVLLGVIFLGERMRIAQWVAVGIAAAGVLYMTIGYGALPWIALTLAFSFGLYGLIKKVTALDALEGLSFETMLMFPPALAFLIYLHVEGSGVFGRSDGITTTLLVLTGVTTGIPLLFFAAAAQRIPLSLLGILQYIAPTMQFLLGVILYNEPFDQIRMVGFGLIWTALLLYTVEGAQFRRRKVRMNIMKV